MFYFNIKAQNIQKESSKPTLITTASSFVQISPLKGKKLITESFRKGEVNPKRKDANKIVPGKGLPKNQDPLLVLQNKNKSLRSSKIPSLVFEANSSNRSPTDPTGAVGPNHYVSAKNSAFAIHDKAGNVLISSTGLENHPRPRRPIRPRRTASTARPCRPRARQGVLLPADRPGQARGPVGS